MYGASHQARSAAAMTPVPASVCSSLRRDSEVRSSILDPPDGQTVSALVCAIMAQHFRREKELAPGKGQHCGNVRGRRAKRAFAETPTAAKCQVQTLHQAHCALAAVSFLVSCAERAQLLLRAPSSVWWRALRSPTPRASALPVP